MFSGKCFSQTIYSDSVVVNVSDLVFKKDTGTSSKYFLHINIGFRPIASLQSLEISFLDHTNTVLGSTGIYNALVHAKGFYYIESPAHQKIIAHGQHIEFMMPFTLSEYNGYEKIRITHVSQSEVIENKLFTILKQ